jgi:hypothetical protein
MSDMEDLKRQLKQHKLAKASQRTGETCGGCGKVFEPGEFRSRGSLLGVGSFVTCGPCSKDSPDQYAIDEEGEPMIRECCGCGAPLGQAPFSTWNGQEALDACSHRCRRRLQARVKRGSQQYTGHYSCARCGVSLGDVRTDRKFCSGRCRVAAHRDTIWS